MNIPLFHPLCLEESLSPFCLYFNNLLHEEAMTKGIAGKGKKKKMLDSSPSWDKLVQKAELFIHQ